MYIFTCYNTVLKDHLPFPGQERVGAVVVSLNPLGGGGGGGGGEFRQLISPHYPRRLLGPSLG